MADMRLIPGKRQEDWQPAAATPEPAAEQPAPRRRRRRRRRERLPDEPLHRGIYLLPNLLTTCGLFSGFYSIISTISGEYQAAALCILVAHVFDGLDGRIARLTKTASRFGIEYDSLADVIAFGVAPGILVYKWALEPWGNWGRLAASLYVAWRARRLAPFNGRVDDAGKDDVVGVP